MKKLMITAAAALCATVGFSSIESANVVGYQNIEIVGGFNMITPTFDEVAGGDYSIQNVKPSGEGVGGWGDVNIQFIDTAADWSDQYWWWTAEMGAPEGVDGWYDADNALATAKIKSGTGFVIYAEGDAVVQVAGSVDMNVNPVPMLAGFNGGGNAKPIKVDVQDLIPSGEGVGGWGDVNIQFIDAAGDWSDQYWWWTAEMGAPEGVDGWYDADNALATAKVNAGAGFVLYAEGDCVLTIPSIEK